MQWASLGGTVRVHPVAVVAAVPAGHGPQEKLPAAFTHARPPEHGVPAAHSFKSTRPRQFQSWRERPAPLPSGQHALAEAAVGRQGVARGACCALAPARNDTAGRARARRNGAGHVGAGAIAGGNEAGDTGRARATHTRPSRRRGIVARTGQLAQVAAPRGRRTTGHRRRYEKPVCPSQSVGVRAMGWPQRRVDTLQAGRRTCPRCAVCSHHRQQEQQQQRQRHRGTRGARQARQARQLQ
jgi:hypothetical protein